MREIDIIFMGFKGKTVKFVVNGVRHEGVKFIDRVTIINGQLNPLNWVLSTFHFVSVI